MFLIWEVQEIPPLEAWSRQASVSVASMSLPGVKEGLDFFSSFLSLWPKGYLSHIRCGERESIPLCCLWKLENASHALLENVFSSLGSSCFPPGWAVLLCTGELLVEISGRKRPGFQTQPQAKWSPHQGMKMSHSCSPFWLYSSVGCDTRNLATQQWWHHFFCNKFGSLYRMPYRKKSSHHRQHWIPKEKLMWLCALLLCPSTLPQGFY